MPDTVLDVRLLESDLDAMAAQGQFMQAHGAAGAVVSFSGQVRGDGGAQALYLDWYPGMSERSLQEIAEATVARFDVMALTVLHRCGEVKTGEAIVFVAAASKHRRAAFEAVDYAMDRLKSEAALWKREITPEGSHWIEPRAADADDLKRWNNE